MRQFTLLFILLMTLPLYASSLKEGIHTSSTGNMSQAMEF